jgi:hypothetical protein
MKKKELTANDTFQALKRPHLDVGFINYRSIEVENVDTKDYPDFCDAFISYAEFKNGVELTEDQIEQLNDEHSDLVYEAAFDSIY